MAARVAWALWAVAAALVTGYAWLAVADRSVPVHLYGYLGAIPLVCFAFATVGAVVAARIPRNAVGWLFLAIALILLVTADAQLYAIRGYLVAPGSLPFAAFAGWIGSWLWGPGVALTVVFVPLLFPDGRPPGVRWRLWARVAAAIVLLQAVAAAFITYPKPTSTVDTTGQFLTAVTGTLAGVIFNATYVLIVPLCVISVASLFLRRRHADAVVRQQLKFFLYAGVLVLIGVAASAVGNTVGGASGTLYDIGASILVTSVGAVPVAAGLAILRYRLYDIDVVISRTLVFGTLAVLITGVYVGIAVGIGELVGSGGKPNLGLSILATAIVAVGFQPARERLQRIANRLVYGRRASPYQVLSEFSAQVAGSYAADEVLPRMARVLQEGTSAESATVWLNTDGSLRAAARWPDAGALGTVPAANGMGAGAEMHDSTRLVEVRDHDALLGALSVSKRRGESLTPVEEKLLDDLAHQAGLVLRNVRLTADLQRRLEDLRASRQRLVSAQDAERRRLERNLHDGAQQHLVALKVKLGLAEMLAGRDPEKAKATITQLKADTDDALETLRDLARGIYPPLLAEKGLPTALESQARKATLPVDVQADGVGRYPQDLEATVYFCVLEALQNVQKYAEATHATIRLAEIDRSFVFEVEDDGRGFDVDRATKGSGLTNMLDRVDSVGGAVAIRSAAGKGVTVAGRIPLPEVSAARTATPVTPASSAGVDIPLLAEKGGA